MFSSGNRYITKGVDVEIPLALIMIMWGLIDRKKEHTELDYLQIFTLTHGNKKQTVIHEQEQPKAFSDKYTLDLDYGFIGKVYVIDDGDHETMLLAEEY